MRETFFDDPRFTSTRNVPGYAGLSIRTVQVQALKAVQWLHTQSLSVIRNLRQNCQLSSRKGLMSSFYLRNSAGSDSASVAMGLTQAEHRQP